MPRKSVVLIAAAAALSSAVGAANIARSRAVGPYLNLTKAERRPWSSRSPDAPR
jgi:hypothetical protein